MRPNARRLAIGLVLLGTLAPVGRGAPAAPLLPRPDEVDEAELPPPEPPPELSRLDRARLERALKTLRNSNAERRRATEQDIVEIGRGAIPELVDAATTDHEGKIDGLVTCLVALATIDDRELVAESLDSELVALRRFAVRKVGELGLPSHLDALEARLEDEDEDVRLSAGLALVANEREAAVTALVPHLDGPRRDEILRAVAGLRGAGPHTALRAMLSVDKQREKRDPEGYADERRAVVAILHEIGDDAAVAGLARALDDPHNVVQRDAIDALRDLVEDKGPFEATSIFQQIKEVERLKALVAG